MGKVTKFGQVRKFGHYIFDFENLNNLTFLKFGQIIEFVPLSILISKILLKKYISLSLNFQGTISIGTHCSGQLSSPVISDSANRVSLDRADKQRLRSTLIQEKINPVEIGLKFFLKVDFSNFDDF